MLVKKLPVLLLVFLIGFPQVTETIFTPSLPAISSYFNASREFSQTTLGTYFLGFTLGVIFWGILSDKVGRRRSMQGGLCLFILSTIACALSPSLWLLLIFRFFQSFGASVGSVVTLAIIQERFSGLKRDQTLSQIGAILSLGIGIGPIIGGFAVDYYGWQMNLWILTGLGALLLFVSSYFLHDLAPIGVQPHLDLKKVVGMLNRMVHDRLVIGCSIAIGASNAIMVGYWGNAPFIFIDVLHYSPIYYGIFSVTVAFCLFCSGIFSHMIAPFSTARQRIFIGSLLTTIGALAFYWTHLIGFISKETPVFSAFAIMIPTGVLCFGIGLVLPNCLSVALENQREHMGTASAIFHAVYYLFICLFVIVMLILPPHPGHSKADFFVLMAMISLSTQYWILQKA